MNRVPSDPDRVFRALARRLTARRAGGLGTRLWSVIAVLAVSIAAFTYWQVRVPLDGTLRHGGVAAAVARLAAVLGGFVLAGAVLAATRRLALLASPPGPEWLALPLPPAAIERHLAREAAAPARAVLVPALAAWWAGAGLLPVPALAALALALWGSLELALRLACAAALAFAAGASGPARRLSAPWRALVSARRPARTIRHAIARFRREPRWRALARLDRRVSRRAGPTRVRLLVAGVFLVLSVVAWGASEEPLQARALAFAAFAIACTELGAWAAWRAAGDPAPAVRPLPISLADAWRARASALGMVIGGVLAPGLAPIARVGLALSWALPATILGLLGLHVGLSLPGRPRPAEGFYYGWLGVGLIGSMAIPLFGWLLLGAGLVQATRRLPRWRTPEVA
jgi:hypothetical protein